MGYETFQTGGLKSLVEKIFAKIKDAESNYTAKLPSAKAIVLPVSGWDSSTNTQVVSCDGILADESAQLIQVVPKTAYMEEYINSRVICIGQAENKLTFKCETVPSLDVECFITIQNYSALQHPVVWSSLNEQLMASFATSNDLATQKARIDSQETKVTTNTNDISSLKSGLTNKIYPVGSIYMSVNSTNPAVLFGGSWEQLKDRFLLAAGSTYAAGSTGGEASHTLTVNEMPKHNHEMPPWMWAVSAGFNNGTNNISGGTSTGNAIPYTDGKSKQSQYSESVGGGSAHNNMPPYLTIYMWKRTA